ncbi:uncharacterized protein FFNC_15418 [Fusarium fujikuroi]|nr:uncharacterized protein FFNC_15418 [Fusarium fujikuroi]
MASSNETKEASAIPQTESCEFTSAPSLGDLPTVNPKELMGQVSQAKPALSSYPEHSYLIGVIQTLQADNLCANKGSSPNNIDISSTETQKSK